MPSCRRLAASIISKRSSTPPPLVFKAPAGDGSYVASLYVVLVLTNVVLIVQGLNPSTKRLEIVTTANQDPLLTHVPIIGVDIWEHAFYLQYLNVKVDVRFHQWSFFLCLFTWYLVAHSTSTPSGPSSTSRRLRRGLSSLPNCSYTVYTRERAKRKCDERTEKLVVFFTMN
jgi:hypothetical protein